MGINNNNKYNNKDYVDISSGRSIYKKKFPWAKLALSVFFLTLGICGSALIYAYNILQSLNYQEINYKHIICYIQK